MNNNHNILRFQSSKLDDNDIIVCDGVTIEESGQRRVCINELYKHEFNASRKKIPWCGKVDGRFFVKGLLSQKDESGRIMSFVFVSANSKFTDDLFTYLHLMGVSLDIKTKKILLLYRNRKYIFIASALLLVFFLVITKIL